jgi:hypothetical protein
MMACIPLIILLALVPADAAEKPVVTRVDARYLDRMVVFTVEWQSPNPVSSIRVHIGKIRREIKVDEYDNRRNQAGYWGESTVEFALAPEQGQDGVPYLLQLEDELRQKSDQFNGKVMFSASAGKDADDAWGKAHLDKFANPPPLGAPQTSSTPYTPFDPVTGQPQSTTGSYPAGSYPPGGYSPGSGPPGSSPPGSSPSGDGTVFYIENIGHEYRDGVVSVVVTVVEPSGAGVKEIVVVVVDANQNQISGDRLTDISFVNGRYRATKMFQLPDGTYHLQGQAENRNGTLSSILTSKELKVGK